MRTIKSSATLLVMKTEDEKNEMFKTCKMSLMGKTFQIEQDNTYRTPDYKFC